MTKNAPFAADFEIDLINALSGQLLAALNALTPAPLDEPTIASLEIKQGIYVLYHRETIVYVGKAKRLRKRLMDHRRKIAGRKGIKLANMSFKCLYIHRNWTALAPESSLIRHFKAAGKGESAWNGMGFGPHDPGRERETTNKPPDGFDAKYPINANLPCTWVKPAEWNCRELLLSLKKNLPYLLRFEKKASKRYRGGHPDYNNTVVVVPRADMPVSELLRLISRSLPRWQATAFPSHVILYKEDRRYTHGRRL